MAKLEDKLKDMLESDSHSERLLYENESDIFNFVKNCEKVYGKTTNEHINEFINKKYEGNVDEERWYRFGIILKEIGYNF